MIGARTALELVAVAGALAALSAVLAIALVSRFRARETAAARRTALLTAAGALLDRAGGARLDELARMAVPELADLCVIDLLHDDDRLHAEAVAAADPELAEGVRRLRAATEVPVDADHPSALAVRTGESQLVRELTDDQLARAAPSDSYLAAAREAGYRSVIVVPLTARGTVVGALSWVRLRGSHPYAAADLEVAREFARRAGVAVDQARLSGALERTEAELRAVLGALAEAVLVQNPDGEVVYANAAAARMVGAADEHELLARGRAGLWAGLSVDDERGEPITSDMTPGRRALAGEAEPEPLLVRVTHRATGEVFWRLVKASPVFGPDGRPRLAVTIIEDVTEARRDEHKQRFLAQASKLLASSLDIEVTLEKVAWAAVPEIADWCTVDMPDERGRLRRVATADVEGARRGENRLVVGGMARSGELPVGPPQVLASGRSEVYTQIDEAVLRAAARDDAQFAALQRVGALSAIIVPLAVGERVIGTISVGTTRDSGRRLSEADLDVLEELGRRAGMAVENARIHTERVAIATTLQDALLPPELPVIPGVDIAMRFHAAGEASRVGGDFYDVFAVPGAWMVLIGDVTGKGPAAAAVTAMARYTMRTAARYEPSPARVLARLNDALCEAQPTQLCTAACVRLSPVLGGRVLATVASAGHPPPLLVRSSGVVAPTAVSGPLLGAFTQGAWENETVPVDIGESLVLYTDGVTDALGAEERFGDVRLTELLAAVAGSSADAIAERVDRAVADFQLGDQRDDVALLVLQASGGATGAAGEPAVIGELRGE